MEDGFKKEKETEDGESLNVAQEIGESNGTAGTGNATQEAWAAQDPTPAAAVHETDTTRVSENELAAFEADVDGTGMGQVMQEDTTQIEETTVVAGAGALLRARGAKCCDARVCLRVTTQAVGHGRLVGQKSKLTHEMNTLRSSQRGCE